MIVRPVDLGRRRSPPPRAIAGKGAISGCAAALPLYGPVGPYTFLGVAGYACTTGSAFGSAGSGLPGLRIRPQTIAPKAKIPAAHQKATV